MGYAVDRQPNRPEQHGGDHCKNQKRCDSDIPKPDCVQYGGRDAPIGIVQAGVVHPATEAEYDDGGDDIRNEGLGKHRHPDWEEPVCHRGDEERYQIAAS